MFSNVYAFTPQGTRLIIGLGLTYHEAVTICEAQREYLPPIERYGDAWLDSRREYYGVPRLSIHPANIDPFSECNSRIKWVELDEL